MSRTLNRSCCSFLLATFLLIVTSTRVYGAGAGSSKWGINNRNDLTSRGLFSQINGSEVMAQAGATATLHCQVNTHLGDGLVSWVRRRDYNLLTVGEQVHSSDQRFGIKVASESNDWMLTIRWVQPEDGGQYECQVPSHPPQSLFVNLRVVEAHSEIAGGPDRYIHTGSALRLACLMRKMTEPPVYVFWYREDRMINYDKLRGVVVKTTRDVSTLYLNSVTREDAGNYTCVPSNARPSSVLVHVVQKENPAGLQQETTAEKEPTPTNSAPLPPLQVQRGTTAISSATELFQSLVLLPIFTAVLANFRAR
ncbi:limbic system-associated membrane protein-like [Oratosquilla oratoria]|uniref:limbic system-associated membrane protein-like n=1 Tax=Oratosquilla oratoria TaxID=337810 RepID=UPI003F7776EA